MEEFAFDKTRKLISAAVEINDARLGLVRGAPERILARSGHWLANDTVREIGAQDRRRLLAALESFAAKGFRVVGFAYKDLAIKQSYRREELEEDMIYLGFAALSDPPRPEDKKVLKNAETAGIKTMMLTGDNMLTARAIAEEVDLLKKGDEVMLGEQVDQLTDIELDRVLPKIKIIARATPEQKMRIVQSLQRQKEVVAVTGDGINDALALKQADVGVAMGITGTDVAKQASDIILTDDQYATIVAAVEEGRRIDDNLTQVVRYLVAGNLSEILTVLLAVLFVSKDGGFATPLLPVQILWVNIVTDAFAFAVSAADKRVLRRGPKTSADQPLNNSGLIWVMLAASLIALSTLLVFYFYLGQGLAAARTAAFSVLVIGQMVMAAVVARSFGGRGWRSHKWVALAILATLAAQALLLLEPTLRQAFHLVPLW